MTARPSAPPICCEVVIKRLTEEGEALSNDLK